jgi:ERF superfamily
MELKSSETIGKLAEALAKAQGEMDNAKKDSSNPFFKSKYADLAAVIDSIKEPLSKNSLSYVQFLDEENEKSYLITKLMHSSGEWISGRLKLILKQQDMQGMGSAITYARRYSISSMVGLAQDDDDGNIASGKKEDFKNFQPQQKPINQTPQPIPQKQEWKMTQLEIDYLVTLSEAAKWPGAAVKAYIQNNFKKQKANDLTREEYQKLCDAFKTPIKPEEKSEFEKFTSKPL